MDHKALAEQLVKTCLAKGADAAEIYLQAGRHLSIDVRNGELETVEESASQGAGFRVFVKGRMAFSSCNDFRPASLESAAARAVDLARSTTADPNNVLPTDAATTPVDGLYDPAIARVPMEKKIELAIALEKAAMTDRRITKSAGAGYGEWEAEIFLANSHGLSKTYKSSSCSLGVSVVAEKGEQKSSGGESCSRRFFADLLAPARIAERAAASAIELLDPRMVKTQRAAVIFDPDVAYAILGGILQAVNGERVLQGASFLGAMLNQEIASDLVTLVDDGVRPKGPGSAPFDGEGVPTGRHVIVEKGVLKAFMYNTAVAKRAGARSTGNASRGGFTSLPGIGPHNFYMAAGMTPPADILKATKTGLWVKGVTGYGINAVNGNFSGGAEGLWIENGRVAFPVKGLTIAGTAAEMLNGIDLVGTELDLNRGTAAPMFRIKDMQIGGE
ncbi:MAG: TldD/PmbA family protein [Acidobacteria bacterium]|nr:MAG: TldD/PmbA family protein [Acidobacteriota bacterium]